MPYSRRRSTIRARVRGHEAHSSLAPQGVNAVEYAAELIVRLNAIARRMTEEGPFDTLYDVPFTTVHTGTVKGGTALNFGSYGLKALEPERVTARQIVAARRAITRHMKRAGRVWIRIFPDLPVSKKPTEVRMGSGKGSPEFWACRIRPGRIMFEIDGVNEEIAREALRLASMKLPIKTRTVVREDW